MNRIKLKNQKFLSFKMKLDIFLATTVTKKALKKWNDLKFMWKFQSEFCFLGKIFCIFLDYSIQDSIYSK